VVYVCTNGAGDYSPGVYVHGGAGGKAALECLRGAAPNMRAAEVGDAAAGLCGYLYKQFGGGSHTGLALFHTPKLGADGTVDWEAYAGWNVDVVVINLRRGTAVCYSSPGQPGAGPKVEVGRIEGLTFGD